MIYEAGLQALERRRRGSGALPARAIMITSRGAMLTRNAALSDFVFGPIASWLAASFTADCGTFGHLCTRDQGPAHRGDDSERGLLVPPRHCIITVPSCGSPSLQRHTSWPPYPSLNRCCRPRRVGAHSLLRAGAAELSHPRLAHPFHCPPPRL